MDDIFQLSPENVLSVTHHLSLLSTPELQGYSIMSGVIASAIRAIVSPWHKPFGSSAENPDSFRLVGFWRVLLRPRFRLSHV
jgi:hypothetical protein